MSSPASSSRSLSQLSLRLPFLSLLLLLLLAHSLPLIQGQSGPGRMRLAQSSSFPNRHWTAAVHPDTGSSRADPAAQHRFKWHLPRADGAAEWLQRQFEQTTDPTHPRYQHWVDKDEVMQRIAPPSSISQPVLQWLAQHGVDTSATSAQVKQHGDVLEVTATVSTVEALFGVELHHHGRENSSSTVVRAKGAAASIPAALASSLRDGGLQQVYDLPPLFTRNSLQSYRQPSIAAPTQPSSPASLPHSFHTLSRGAKPDCSAYPGNSSYIETPASFVRQLYNFSASQTTALVSNGQQVAALAGEALDDSFSGVGGLRSVYSPTDLAIFAAQYNYSLLPQISPEPYAQQNALLFAQLGVPTGEATLDIQALYAYAPDSEIGNIIGMADDGPAELAFDVYYNIPAAQRPAVISQSLAYNQEFNLDPIPAYTDAVYQLLALAGVTVVTSSGDYGAPGPLNLKCRSSPSSDGYRESNTVGPLVPLYPNTSPYVLSVGATDTFYKAGTALFGDLSSEGFCGACGSRSNATILCQNTIVAEEAVTTFSSTTNTYSAGYATGGGFSNLEAQPTWQADFVSAYLTTQCTAAHGCTLPSSTYYNKANRAYPDVAFVGTGFPLIGAGTVSLGNGGTSLSAPGWAAIISRLNAISVSITGKTLGFVNPLLYYFQRQYLANPTSTLNPFNDVVIGNNICPPGGACKSATSFSTCSGFYAAPGWDPVTGLGTPNVGHLETLLTAFLTANGSSGLSTVPVPMQAAGGTLDPLSLSLYNQPYNALTGNMFSGFAFQPDFPYTLYGLSVYVDGSQMSTSANLQLSLYNVDLDSNTNITATLVDYTGNVVIPAGFVGRVNLSTISRVKPALDFEAFTVMLQTDNNALIVPAAAYDGALVLLESNVVYSKGALPPSALISLEEINVAFATTVLTAPFTPTLLDAADALNAASSSTGAASAVSDPRLVGFWGQSFFVSGAVGGVYCLLSDEVVQLNAYMVYLQRIRCPEVDGRVMQRCFDEAGQYFGVLSIRVQGGEYVRITAGAVDVGFHSVSIGDAHTLQVGDSYNGTAKRGGGSEQPLLQVTRLTARQVRVQAGMYVLIIDNVDLYVDVTALDVDCWHCLLSTARPDGLLGRTWNATADMSSSNDRMEEYRERSDDLLGCAHMHDRFCHTATMQQLQSA